MMSITKSNEFTFTWRVDNFSSCDQKIGEKIVSPTFFAENLNESKWKLFLYPRGDKAISRGFLSCFLKNVDFNSENIKLDYFEIKIIAGENEILTSLSSKNSEFKNYHVFGWSKALELERIYNSSKNYPDDILTIICRMKMPVTKNKFPTGCDARTKIGVDRFCFQWTIKYSENQTWLESKTFLFPEEPSIEIVLTSPADQILITILRTRAESLPARFTSCKISLIDLNGIERRSKSASYLLESDTWEFPSFFTKTELEKNDLYLENGTFTLAFKLSISNENQLKEIEKYVYCNYSNTEGAGSVEPMSNFQDDFRNLFNSKKYSDVKLKVGELIFPVHKFILVARSPVFSTMFEQNMLETQTGIIDIRDINAETLEIFLEYLYTDSIRKIDFKLALSLLIAADKYQVLGLKEKCSTFLISSFSGENVCEILATADTVGQKCLKASAIDYIKTRSEDILPTVEWCQWVEKNLKLGIEVLAKLSAELGSLKQNASNLSLK